FYIFWALAEGERFELSRLSPGGFQDRCTRPLCDPSRLAESTGFEPVWYFRANGLANRPLKPLGQLSNEANCTKVADHLLFLVYVLAFVPPSDLVYRLSSQGITLGEHFYFWHDLDSFWVKQQDGVDLAYVQTHLHFPGQLILVLTGVNQEEVKKIIARFLLF